MPVIDLLSGWGLLQPLAWTLLHSLWQGALVAAVLGGVLLLAGRRTGIRYAAAALALTLLVAMPAATFALLVPGVNAAPGKMEAAAATHAEAAGSFVPESAPAATSAFTPTGGHALAQPAASQGSQRSATMSADNGTQALTLDAIVHTYGPALVALWLVGVVLLTLRLTGGFMVMQRLRRKRVSLPSVDVLQAFASLARKAGLRRVPALRISRMVDVPMVLGVIRPLVLLPVSALSGLSARDLELLLAHELAHVRRHDLLVNALQRVVEILFFYHPAAWWVSAVMRAEREHACDERAVELAGSSEPEYVAALARLGEARLQHAFAAAATGGSLLARVQRLLGRQSGSGGVAPLVTFSTLLAAFALLLTGTAAPQADVAPDQGFTTVWATRSNGVLLAGATGAITAIPGEAWLLIEERRDGQLVRRGLATNTGVPGHDAHEVTPAPFTMVPTTYLFDLPSGATVHLHIEEGPLSLEDGREAVDWFADVLNRVVVDHARAHGADLENYSMGWALRADEPDRFESLIFGSFWSHSRFLAEPGRFPLPDDTWARLAAHALAHGMFDSSFVAGVAADRLRSLAAEGGVRPSPEYLLLLPLFRDDEARLEVLVAFRAAVREPDREALKALGTALETFSDPATRLQAERFLDGRGLPEVPERMLPFWFSAGTATFAGGDEPSLVLDIVVSDLEVAAGSPWRLFGPDGDQIMDGELQVSWHRRSTPLASVPRGGTYVVEVDIGPDTERIEIEVDAGRALMPPRNLRVAIDGGRPALAWDPVAGAVSYEVTVGMNGADTRQIRTLEHRIDLLAALPSFEADSATALVVSVLARSGETVCRGGCEVHFSSASDIELEYQPGANP